MTIAPSRTSRRATPLFALVVAVLAFFAGSTALYAPAAAHSGGKAIPLVTDFTIAPSAGSWTASATVVDFDSGDALTAVDVQLKGAGLAKFTPMRESATPGTYVLALPSADPGPVELTLQIVSLPGGTEVTNFSEKYARTLAAGQPLHVVGSTPKGESGGGTNAGMIVGGTGALLLVAVICSMLAMRSRGPATTALTEGRGRGRGG